MDYNQQYSIILDLETKVWKRDLDLGFQDPDQRISKYALGQLLQMFPSSLYDMTETLFSYSFSLKRDIPADDILSLRQVIYQLMEIEDDIEYVVKDFGKANIAELVAFAQRRYVWYYNPRYDMLRWRTYRSYLSIYRSPDCKYTDSLKVVRAGIQIYLSDDFFASELGGSLYLIEKPLRKLLRHSKYSDIVSVRIEE